MPNTNYAFYTAAGEIVKWGSIDATLYDAKASINPAVTGKAKADFPIDPAKMFVASGTVVVRPALAIPNVKSFPADGNSAINCNCPVGTEIWFGGSKMGVADSSGFVFKTTEKGTYDIELRPPFPYLTATFTVTAT